MSVMLTSSLNPSFSERNCVGGETIEASTAPDFNAPNMFDMVLNCIKMTSLLGSILYFRSAVRAAMSAADPKRLTAMRLPRSSSMLLTSGLVWSEKINLLTVLPMTLTSAPPSEAAMTGPPPREPISTSPATNTWVSDVPLGMKIIWSSNPSLVKRPASRATQMPRYAALIEL